MLLPEYYSAVKADILASPDLLQWWNAGNPGVIAELYNTAAAPDYIVWRTSVPFSEVMNYIDWTRVDNLTNGSKYRIWEYMDRFSGGMLNPSQENTRKGIDATWIGTAADLAVRASIYARCKRLATRLEKVLATGSGTTASPSVMGFEGLVRPEEIQQAMAV